MAGAVGSFVLELQEDASVAGEAGTILNVDDAIPEPILAEIRALPDIVSAKLVKL